MEPIAYRSANESNAVRRVSWLLWVGLAVLVVGSGPLLVIMAAAALGLTADPNPNPVGLGMMAMCTFWPGIGMTIAGALITFRNRRLGRQSQTRLNAEERK